MKSHEPISVKIIKNNHDLFYIPSPWFFSLYPWPRGTRGQSFNCQILWILLLNINSSGLHTRSWIFRKMLKLTQWEIDRRAGIDCLHLSVSFLDPYLHFLDLLRPIFFFWYILSTRPERGLDFTTVLNNSVFLRLRR